MDVSMSVSLEMQSETLKNPSCKDVPRRVAASRKAALKRNKLALVFPLKDGYCWLDGLSLGAGLGLNV